MLGFVKDAMAMVTLVGFTGGGADLDGYGQPTRGLNCGLR